MPQPDHYADDLITALSRARSANREFAISVGAWATSARKILDAAQGPERDAFTELLLAEVDR
jgi:hypothetical protein